MASNTDVRVRRRAAERVTAGHPWVFRSDLVQPPEIPGGSIVQVFDERKERLGWAHYSSASQIALRMLPQRADSLDRGFFRNMFARAQQYRDRVTAGADAYRLIHGEADQLPGLIIDRYGDYFSLQTLSQGMDAAKEAIIAALEDAYAPRGIAERNDAHSRFLEKLPSVAQMLRGDAPEDLTVTLDGLTFAVDLVGGQKTGLFLDQRENWLAAAQYGRGRALDCFCYSGGFAMNLARVCDSVEAVDSSDAAVARVRSNLERNNIENVTTKTVNVFDLLSDYDRSRRKYELIVLDPPAFAKARRHTDSAGRAYKEINLKALRLLEPGGILVTCSCSHHFSEADLLNAVASAALDCRKTLRVVERRTQARDHPIALTIPETHYLKCLIFEVV